MVEICETLDGKKGGIFAAAADICMKLYHMNDRLTFQLQNKQPEPLLSCRGPLKTQPS